MAGRQHKVRADDESRTLPSVVQNLADAPMGGLLKALVRYFVDLAVPSSRCPCECRNIRFLAFLRENGRGRPRQCPRRATAQQLLKCDLRYGYRPDACKKLTAFGQGNAVDDSELGYHCLALTDTRGDAIAGD